jgi:hypothetical protein
MDTDTETIEEQEHSINVPLKAGRNLLSLSDRQQRANSLTKKDKEILFSVGIAEGLPVETAYIKAFGECRPTVAQRKGAKLAVSPRVMEMIKAERSKRQTKGLEEGDRLRMLLVSRLEYEAIHAKADSARMSALRMIGELGHVQAFKPPVGEQVAELPSDMEAKLSDLMKRITLIEPGSSG